MTRETNVRFLSSSKGSEHYQAMERLRGLLSTEGAASSGSMPFSPEDTTAGSETELQAAVAGSNRDVDLPLIIEQPNYLANIMRRTAALSPDAVALHVRERAIRSGQKRPEGGRLFFFPPSRFPVKEAPP